MLNLHTFVGARAQMYILTKKNNSQTGKIDIEKLAEQLCIEQSNVKGLVQRISTDKNWTVLDDLILTQ